MIVAVEKGKNTTKNMTLLFSKIKANNVYHKGCFKEHKLVKFDDETGVFIKRRSR